MKKDEFNKSLNELVEDRIHGASELARQGLQIMMESALHAEAEDTRELLRLLNERVYKLIATRPSMAPLYNLLERWRDDIEKIKDFGLVSFREKAAQLAASLVDSSTVAVEVAAANACELIGDKRTIITHSLSSTVLAVFRRLACKEVRAIISESRPLYEGYKLAASLSEWSIPTMLITDAQLGLFVEQADLVLVGVDSLLADGSAVNKVGTYSLAATAFDLGVPFYVCCESFKQRSTCMNDIYLEEMEPVELSAPGWPGVTVRNIYFDITPARLITAWITEQGIRKEW